jgi:hypothetical protein
MAKRELTDMEVLAQIPAARAREAADRKAGLRATSVSYDPRMRRIVMELTNGFLFAFPTRIIPTLAHRSAAQLAAVSLLPGGSGLRWEALDVDLSVPGLLLSAMAPAQRMQELARAAGKVRSPAKANAARANGAKGGRPKKVA